MNALRRRFFLRLPVRAVEHDDALHLLNPAEVRAIRNRHHLGVAVSASLAVFGGLAYYLPSYWLPEYFHSIEISLAWFGISFRLPWVQLLWGLIPMLLELNLLVFVNIWAVHATAVATGLIDDQTKNERVEQLLHVALSEKRKGLLRFGIDPLLGINRGALFAYTLLLRLKGFLGKKVLQYVVRHVLGRLAVRELLDFLGMPIYMFLNAWSTHVVIREAKIHIMGQQLIVELGRRLPPRAEVDDPEARALLYDTLQLVAVSKRDFHANHYLLAKTLIETYEVEFEHEKPLARAYIDRLAGAPERLKRLCALVLILGFVLDGKITRRERRRLRELRAAGALDVDVEQVQCWCQEFIDGAGVSSLLSDHLDDESAPRDGREARDSQGLPRADEVDESS
jgi:hypothetical protein